jgi:hypothetical protein
VGGIVTHTSAHIGTPLQSQTWVQVQCYQPGTVPAHVRYQRMADWGVTMLAATTLSQFDNHVAWRFEKRIGLPLLHPQKTSLNHTANYVCSETNFNRCRSRIASTDRRWISCAICANLFFTPKLQRLERARCTRCRESFCCSGLPGQGKVCSVGCSFKLTRTPYTPL